MNPHSDQHSNHPGENGSPPSLDAVPHDVPELEADGLPILDLDMEATSVEPVIDLLAADEAVVIGTPTVGRFRLPNAGWAIVWLLLLLGSQLVAGLIVGVALSVTVLADGPISTPDDLAERIAGKQQLLNWVLVPLASLLTLTTALVAVLLTFRRETARCMGLRGMTATQTLLVLLSVLPCALLASEVTNCASEILPNMPLDLFSDFAKESWWLVFVAACLFPGVGEELFFRGFLSRGLVAHHGVWLGSLITAFYFGAIHLHPIQATGAFALGIALQFVFLTTRSLWGAVLLHTANNAVAFLAMKYGDLVPILGFTTNSLPAPITEGVPTPDYDQLIEAANGTGAAAHTAPALLLAATIVVGALAWGLWRTRTCWLRSDGTEWSHDFVSAEGPRPETRVQAIPVRLDAITIAVVLLANVAFFAALFFHVQR